MMVGHVIDILLMYEMNYIHWRDCIDTSITGNKASIEWNLLH